MRFFSVKISLLVDFIHIFLGNKMILLLLVRISLDICSIRFQPEALPTYFLCIEFHFNANTLVNI